MKEITVNNDRTLTLQKDKNGIEVVVQDGGGGIEYSYIIPLSFSDFIQQDIGELLISLTPLEI